MARSPTSDFRTERLGVGLLAALLALPLVGTPSFCLDDSFIHLVYVESLRLGQGLSYNPHDWETGITSPLWVLVLAAWPFGMPTVFGIKCLGVLLHAAMSMLVAACARAADPELGTRFALTAGLLCAATPLLLQGATSGMEVTLGALLCAATTHALLVGRVGLAALLCGLCYLARPEAAVYTTVLAALLAAQERRPRLLLAVAGTVAAVAAFALYCQAVSGYPLPNTFYVKGGGPKLSSLHYLAVDVALQQPVIAGGGGIVLIGCALLRDRNEPSRRVAAVLGAAVVALLAIALSRPLYDGVQFYQSRYFAIVLWVLPLSAAYGFATLPRAPGYALLAPVVLATALLVYDSHKRQLDQERGVVKLHVEPAAFIARKLPDARVVGVEGAGALRYFTPRSIEIVDLIGLNDRRIAHVPGSLYDRLCAARERGLTHLAYPAQWRDKLHRAFQLDDLVHFTEPAYAQIDPPTAWQLTVARIEGSRPEFSAYCDRARR